MLNIFLGNHTITGKKTLLDWVEWLSYNFKSNEIEFKISNKIDSSSINIIFDNFFFDSYYYLKKYKIKYGIIETEYPINGTFNNINNDAWKARRYSFDQVAKNALFIWSMGKWVDYNDNNKVSEIVLTYTPELSNIKTNIEGIKKYDFVFTGPVNSFRSSILKKFEKCSNVSFYDGFLNRKKYEKYVSQGKYYLSLQQSQNWPTISISKMMRALHNQTIPILLNSEYLKNFEMANYSIKIDQNIGEFQIKKLVNEYNKNIQICSDYMNLKKDNFFKLKQLLSLSKDDLTQKNSIIFPNYNLTQPTEKNRRVIKSIFNVRYKIFNIFKKIKRIISKEGY